MLQIRDQRETNWLWVDKRIVARLGQSLGPTPLAVYLVLALHANTSQSCWPSHDTIAKTLGISRPTVMRALNALKDAGLVRIEERKGGDGRTQSCLYTLLDVDPNLVTAEIQPAHNVSVPCKDTLPGLSNGDTPPVKPFDTNKNKRTITDLPLGRSATGETDPEFSTAEAPSPDGVERVEQRSAHALLMDRMFKECWIGYVPPAMGQEGNGAKKMLARGRTDDEIVWCWKQLSRGRKGHVSLMEVNKHIDAMLARSKTHGTVSPLAEPKNGKRTAVPGTLQSDNDATLQRALERRGKGTRAG